MFSSDILLTVKCFSVRWSKLVILFHNLNLLLADPVAPPKSFHCLKSQPASCHHKAMRPSAAISQIIKLGVVIHLDFCRLSNGFLYRFETTVSTLALQGFTAPKKISLQITSPKPDAAWDGCGSRLKPSSFLARGKREKVPEQ